MPGNPLAHGQFVRYLRMCTEQEPVVVFSVVIGAIGAPRTLAPRRPSHQNLQRPRQRALQGAAALIDVGEPNPRAHA